MAAPRRLRMALLEHELAQARFQYNLVLVAILEERFGNRWNFPHCCDAINGKHVAIKKPPQDIRPGYVRVPVEFRPSIGRCPLHRLATGTVLSKALSHIGQSSVGARPVSVKKTLSLFVSDARDTGRYSAVHRPTCFPIWLQWGCDEGAR